MSRFEFFKKTKALFSLYYVDRVEPTQPWQSGLWAQARQGFHKCPWLPATFVGIP